MNEMDAILFSGPFSITTINYSWLSFCYGISPCDGSLLKIPEIPFPCSIHEIVFERNTVTHEKTHIGRHSEPNWW